MDAKRSRRQKKISHRQEVKLAADLGGKLQPGSGNMEHAPGDVRVMGKIRAEAKYTEKDFFILKLEELKKIQMEALLGGLEMPVFQIGFYDAVRPQNLDLYAVIPWTATGLEEKTSDKSIKLNHKGLRLHFHSLEEYDICFEDGGVNRYFRIMSWDHFMATQQEG